MGNILLASNLRGTLWSRFESIRHKQTDLVLCWEPASQPTSQSSNEMMIPDLKPETYRFECVDDTLAKFFAVLS